ncbi:AAA family ATPase, partial [Lactobacillus helveticus]
VLLSVCCFFVQSNHTRKELLFLMFSEINLRNHSSLHKLFYGLNDSLNCSGSLYFCPNISIIA